MPYRSNLSAAVERFNRARRLAHIAAAEVLVEALKDAHRGGHTSGNFVTGNEVSKITRLEPEPLGDGNMQIRVTTLQTNPPYPWFWVVGHHNIFTRKFEQDDRWTPTAAAAATKVSAEFQRVFIREMSA